MFNVMEEDLLMIIDHLLNACELRQALVRPSKYLRGSEFFFDCAKGCQLKLHLQFVAEVASPTKLRSSFTNFGGEKSKTFFTFSGE